MIESREQFKSEYPKGNKLLKGYNPETVWDNYVEKIKPAFGVISRYLSLDNPATVVTLSSALGITTKMWYVCKDIFEEFREVLEVKEDYMKAKSEVDLQIALAKKPTDKGLLEMQLKLHNEDYGKKEDVSRLDIPNTIKIEVADKRMSDEELEPYAPKID